MSTQERPPIDVDAAPNDDSSEWFSPRLDILLAISVVSLMPLLWLFAQDFWVRTRYGYLLFLPLLPAIFGCLRGRLNPNTQRGRSLWCMLLFVTSAVLAVVAALSISPWLGLAALVLALTAWLLERCGGLSWYENVGLLSPLWLLLLLPLSDATDPTEQLQQFVAESTSNVLDLSGVMHLADATKIDIRSGIVPVSTVTSGPGNPYYLFAAGVLLCLLLRPSLLICAVTMLTVPLWSWFGATLHLFVGIVLVDQFDVSIFGGSRHTIALFAILALQIVLLWLQQVGLSKLFSPLEGYSESSDSIQKVFNFIAMWPAKAPHRKSRSGQGPASLSSSRPFHYVILLTGCLLLTAGGIAIYRINATIGLSGLTRQWSVARQLPGQLELETLPQELAGMQRVAYQADGLGLGSIDGAIWTYAGTGRLVALSIEAPYRGFYPAELDSTKTGNKIRSDRQAFEVTEGIGSPTVQTAEILFQEFSAVDPVYGESYIGYASLPVPPFGLDLRSGSKIIEQLPLHPTTVRVSVVADNAEGLRDEDRTQLRALLVSAAALIAGKLEPLPGSN